MYKELTCFKAYDIRGELGFNFNSDIVGRIGKAVVTHFDAESIIIGYDARKTSKEFANVLKEAACSLGADAFMIGLSGTEEMYWAVTQFEASAGIEVTASHNPINFNGLKIVKNNSLPLLHSQDFLKIKQIAERKKWRKSSRLGSVKNIADQAKKRYVEKVLSFIDLKKLKPLKVLINSGNGAAGPTFDHIAKEFQRVSVPTEFVLINHKPDHNFPNGIPNPLIKKNQLVTSNAVKEVGADFGIAFDGDFDRCFFFDENGSFIPGEYIIGLLAEVFLTKEPLSSIVHDPRIIWNIQDIVKKYGARSIESKTGHAFMKEVMRHHNAIYGGEISAHHYFRDFAYCDSGMIPWLLILELLSERDEKLGNLLSERFKKFASSGEINFIVPDAEKAMKLISTEYSKQGTVSLKDGFSCEFEDWRFNIRKSNTESLLRLNVEVRKTSLRPQYFVDLLSSKINAIL